MELPNLPAPSWRSPLPLTWGKALASGWTQAPQRKVTHPPPVRSQKPGWLLWQCSGDSFLCQHQPYVLPPPQLLRWAEGSRWTSHRPGLSLALGPVTNRTPHNSNWCASFRHFVGVFLDPCAFSIGSKTPWL